MIESVRPVVSLRIGVPAAVRHILLWRPLFAFSLTIQNNNNNNSSAEVELKPGGRLIAVTNDNVVEYIHRVADFRYDSDCESMKLVEYIPTRFLLPTG